MSTGLPDTTSGLKDPQNATDAELWDALDVEMQIRRKNGMAVGADDKFLSDLWEFAGRLMRRVQALEAKEEARPSANMDEALTRLDEKLKEKGL